MTFMATTDLAHNLGLSVCAEGIENENTFHHLVEFGCDFAQGYFISRPVPPDQIPEWFAGWHGRTQRFGKASVL